MIRSKGNEYSHSPNIWPKVISGKYPESGTLLGSPSAITETCTASPAAMAAPSAAASAPDTVARHGSPEMQVMTNCQYGSGKSTSDAARAAIDPPPPSTG